MNILKTAELLSLCWRKHHQEQLFLKPLAVKKTLTCSANVSYCAKLSNTKTQKSADPKLSELYLNLLVSVFLLSLLLNDFLEECIY